MTLILTAAESLRWVVDYINPANAATIALLGILVAFIVWACDMKGFPRASSGVVRRERQTTNEMARLADVGRRMAGDWTAALEQVRRNLGGSGDKLLRSSVEVAKTADVLASNLARGAEAATRAGEQGRDRALAAVAARETMIEVYNSLPETFSGSYSPRHMVLSSAPAKKSESDSEGIAAPRLEETRKKGVFLLVEEGENMYLLPRVGVRAGHLTQLRVCFHLRAHEGKRRFAVTRVLRPAVCRWVDDSCVLEHKGELDVETTSKKLLQTRAVSKRSQND